MRALVTGGTGYIGSHTCVELLARGHEVSIIDNLRNSSIKVLGRIEKISGVRPAFVCVDIRDEAALGGLMHSSMPSTTWFGPDAD